MPDDYEPETEADRLAALEKRVAELLIWKADVHVALEATVTSVDDRLKMIEQNFCPKCGVMTMPILIANRHKEGRCAPKGRDAAGNRTGNCPYPDQNINV